MEETALCAQVRGRMWRGRVRERTETPCICKDSLLTCASDGGKMQAMRLPRAPAIASFASLAFLGVTNGSHRHSGEPRIGACGVSAARTLSPLRRDRIGRNGDGPSRSPVGSRRVRSHDCDQTSLSPVRSRSRVRRDVPRRGAARRAHFSSERHLGAGRRGRWPRPVSRDGLRARGRRLSLLNRHSRERGAVVPAPIAARILCGALCGLHAAR